MSHHLHNSLVRILTADGIAVGVGFLVAENLILTCAHVIEQASGSDETAHFDLPLLAPGESFSGRVSFMDEKQDIATIEATGLPQSTKPLLLGVSQGSRGHSFLSHGVPRTEQVLTSSGTITGYATLNGIQYLQLESSQVTPGFSGAPVFDEITKRVVGMVVAIAPEDRHKRQGTTAFAVPAETLRAIVPELQLSELCPYRSLDAFTEADAELFFGRERVVTKLLESLKRNPRFLAVLGPSGSGKSSVVQAGLIPALRKGQLSGSEKWGILSIRPGTQPFEQLTSAGMSAPTNLIQAASDWLAAHPENERLLILIDQFEELLVSTPSETQAEFVAALADLLGSSLDVTVLLTLRDDFYNRFTQDAGDLVDWMEAALVNIPPTIEEAELREIIERPARGLGLVFAPGLVDAILADTRTADPSGRALRSTVLPLLEFALTQLWERRVDGELTHDAYRTMGGVTGGLSQWADRAYYALDEAQRAIARRVFSELVTLGDEMQGIADTRRVRSIAELTAKDGEETKIVLDALIAARLLVARHDDVSGQDTIEIIHETLLREWGLLESWLQDDRQFLLWREGLRAAQQAWQESKQDAGALLRGTPLVEAEGWLEKRGDDLGEAEKEYIKSGITLRRKEIRQRRNIFVGMTIAVISIIGILLYSNIQITKEKNRAVANQAAVVSKNSLQEKLDLALLLAVQANKQDNNFQTDDALLLAIQENPSLLKIRGSHSRLPIIDFITDNNVSSTIKEDPITSMISMVDGRLIAFNPNGDQIIIGSILDSTLYILDISSGEWIGKPLTGHNGRVESVAFSSDSKYIVSGSRDNTLRIWDAVTGEQIGEPLLGHTDWVESISFNFDGNRIVSGGYDNTIRVWDVNSGEQIGEPLTGHSEYVLSVAFSPDGKRIVSGSDDKTIRVWDANSGKQIGGAFIGHSGPVYSVAFSPNGKRIVSGSYDQTIRLWNVDTGKQIGDPLIGHSGAVFSVAFSPDGSLIVSGSDDSSIRFWDSDLEEQIGETLIGHSGAVSSVAFRPNGANIISRSSDHTIRIWNINKGNKTVSAMLFVGHNNEAVNSVVFSPDGKRIVSGSDDQTIRIWNTNSGEQIGEPLTGHDGSVNSVAFSPDGSRIVSGSDDNTLRIWDANSGQQIGEPLIGHSDFVTNVAFSPDGKCIISGSDDGTVRFWDTSTGHQIGEPLTELSFSAIFNSNGKQIISRNYANIYVWNANTRQQVGEALVGQFEYIQSIALSPNGKYIASGGSGTGIGQGVYYDNPIRIWDINSRQQIGIPLTGHSEAVNGVVFSLDDKHLISGSDDQTIRIWDVSTGQQIGHNITADSKAWPLNVSTLNIPYIGHRGAVLSISLSPDGDFLVSSDEYGIIHLWDIDINSWREKACQRAGRNLTLQEWNTYYSESIPYEATCPQWPIPDDAQAYLDARALLQKQIVAGMISILALASLYVLLQRTRKRKRK